jgi:hypothetical protein
MGRTHKTLSYEQERKLHRNNHIGRVKGIHRWGDNRKTSNLAPAHVDSDEYESDDENPFYEGILNVFKNGISDPEFSESFLEELQNDSDEMNCADLMISYLDQIITDENISNVPDFGDMTQYDPDDFRDYVENYFRFISQTIMDEWIETYSSI